MFQSKNIWSCSRSTANPTLTWRQPGLSCAGYEESWHKTNSWHKKLVLKQDQILLLSSFHSPYYCVFSSTPCNKKKYIYKRWFLKNKGDRETEPRHVIFRKGPSLGRGRWWKQMADKGLASCNHQMLLRCLLKELANVLQSMGSATQQEAIRAS